MIDIKQQYREETNDDVYAEVYDRCDYKIDYTHWLEKKLIKSQEQVKKLNIDNVTKR